jgi:hypothetical protein
MKQQIERPANEAATGQDGAIADAMALSRVPRA